MNALMSAIGYNFNKLLRALACLLFFILRGGHHTGERQIWIFRALWHGQITTACPLPSQKSFGRVFQGRLIQSQMADDAGRVVALRQKCCDRVIQAELFAGEIPTLPCIRRTATIRHRHHPGFESPHLANTNAHHFPPPTAQAVAQSSLLQSDTLPQCHGDPKSYRSNDQTGPCLDRW